jgi:hypothetical protein
MFKKNYYYLVAGLPDILLDQKKRSLNISAFREELRNHLDSSDYALVEMLFLPFDNINLLNLLLKNQKPFLELGNYSLAFLEEEIKEPAELPDYMQQFIHAFKSDNPVFPDYSWENQLTWLYYNSILTVNNDFLREWFYFTLHINNILAAFSVRKYKLSKDNAFIGNNFVTEALRKSSLKDFGLSNDFQFIERLISIDESNNSMEKEKAVDTLRWEYLDELNTFNYFTIEVLLAFVIKLFMVERWMQLDPETGRQMFKQMISDLEKSYEFPKEFKLNEGRK